MLPMAVASSSEIPAVLAGAESIRAMAALVAGAGVAFVGLIYPPLRIFYDYAWFVSLLVSFVVYYVLRGGSLRVPSATS